MNELENEIINLIETALDREIQLCKEQTSIGETLFIYRTNKGIILQKGLRFWNLTLTEL